MDSLRGIKEVLQYDCQDNRKKAIADLTNKMESSNKTIKGHASKSAAFTNLSILSFSCLLLFVAANLYLNNEVNLTGVIIPVMMLFASFGAVAAVANLGAGLTQTIASGNRVLDILDEKAIIQEVSNKEEVLFEGAKLEEVTFSYDQQVILKEYNLNITKNKILGITGKSGCCKSTVLKLLMRFWDVQQGSVEISSRNVKEINTVDLRKMESYVTQETHIFHDTILNNIKIAKLYASKEEVILACKKASIHEFIESLPKGYDTIVGELGDTISGGEKQRIGIARAFLHQAYYIIG